MKNFLMAVFSTIAIAFKMIVMMIGWVLLTISVMFFLASTGLGWLGEKIINSVYNE